MYYLPGKGYEEQLQDTTKGSAPKSPFSVPLKKRRSLSCQYLSFDAQRSWGWRNKWNLINCPRVPAHFLPPVPSISCGSTRRGGRKEKRHLQKEEKTPTQLKKGQKNQLPPVSPKHKRCRRRPRQPQARIALGESQRSAARRAEQGPRQGPHVSLTRKEGGPQSWLAYRRAPRLPPTLCPLFLTQPREHTARLLLLRRSRTKATAGFAAREAPTAKPSSRNCPRGELWGERCPSTARLPNLDRCTAP